MPEKTHILLRLRSGFGLGDTIFFSVILKHLAKYRPDWQVDVQTCRGMETALVGLCNRSWHNDEEIKEGNYDQVLDLNLYEGFVPFGDRPSSKVTKLLAQTFDLPYDPLLGRYHCTVAPQAQHLANRYLRKVAQQRDDGRFGAVVLHYQGASSPHRKNLQDWQAQEICDLAIKAGRSVVLLDFENRSPLPNNKTVFCPSRMHSEIDFDLWGRQGCGDAGKIGGLIRGAEAFIGVDSGPGKIASSTETPALICWTQNSPVQYHDPAANTTHLLPQDWRNRPPLDGNRDVQTYFEQHYKYRTYSGEHGMVAQALFWLAEVLGVAPEVAGIKFVVPDAIQSVQWAMRKMRGIAQGRTIDVYVSGDPRYPNVALPFVQQIPWVRSCAVRNLPVHVSPERPRNSRGHYHYVPDGMRDGYYYLCPNAVFEAGRPIEEWLPEIPLENALLATPLPSQGNQDGGCAVGTDAGTPQPPSVLLEQA